MTSDTKTMSQGKEAAGPWSPGQGLLPHRYRVTGDLLSTRAAGGYPGDGRGPGSVPSRDSFGVFVLILQDRNLLSRNRLA